MNDQQKIALLRGALNSLRSWVEDPNMAHPDNFRPLFRRVDRVLAATADDPASAFRLCADKRCMMQAESNSAWCCNCVPASAAPVDDDPAETAYWNFDARKKGYAQWKGVPQTERDAFKAEYRAALDHSASAAKGEAQNAEPIGWIVALDSTGEWDGGQVYLDKTEADDYMENRCLPWWHLEPVYRTSQAIEKAVDQNANEWRERALKAEALVTKYEARMLRMATCAGEFARDACKATPPVAPSVAVPGNQMIYELMEEHFNYGNVYGEDAAQYYATAPEVAEFASDLLAAAAPTPPAPVAVVKRKLTDDEIDIACEGIYLSDFRDSQEYDRAIARAVERAIAAHVTGEVK